MTDWVKPCPSTVPSSLGNQLSSYHTAATTSTQHTPIHSCSHAAARALAHQQVLATAARPCSSRAGVPAGAAAGVLSQLGLPAPECYHRVVVVYRVDGQGRGHGGSQVAGGVPASEGKRGEVGEQSGLGLCVSCTRVYI